MCQISALSVDFHFHQLLSAIDSCYQPLTAVYWNFYIDTEVKRYAKFQFSRLFFIFSNFLQLIWAVDKKSNGIFIYSLNVIFVPNLSSVSCLGAKLESVMYKRTEAYRQTPGENNANSGPARLVPGPEFSNSVPKFSSLIQFLLSSAVLSSQKLLTAEDYR